MDTINIVGNTIYNSLKKDSIITGRSPYLYNWYAVDTGKLAPTGWHVPTDAEWTTLGTYLGGDSVAGGKLKETGTTHWTSPNTGTTNEYGFTALPGGYRSSSGSFHSIGLDGYWWSATEYNAINAWYRSMLSNDSNVHRYYYNKEVGFSVRLITDINPGVSTLRDRDDNVYDVIQIGTQWWLQQDLKTTHYNDGELIPNITNNTAWGALTTGALCEYL